MTLNNLASNVHWHAPALQMKYTFLDSGPPDLTENLTSSSLFTAFCPTAHLISHVSVSLTFPLCSELAKAHPSFRFFTGAVPLPRISSPLLFSTWPVFIVQSSLKGTSNKDSPEDIPSSFIILFSLHFFSNIFTVKNDLTC